MTTPRTVLVCLALLLAALALCGFARGADAPPAQILTVGADGTVTTFVPAASTRPATAPVVTPPVVTPPVVIAPPPNPPPATQPAGGYAADYTLRAGLAYHADARGLVANFDFGDPAGAYNTQTGYNAAHVYDLPGLYSVAWTDAAGTVTRKAVRVTADARPVVPWRPGQPIRPGTIHDLGGATVNVTAEIRLDAADATVRNGGLVWASPDPPPHGQIVWVRASNCTLENVRLGSTHAKPKGPTGGAKVGVGGVQVGIADGPSPTALTVLRNVTGDDLDTFALVRDQARSTLILDCSTGDALRGYGVFAEGCKWTVVAGFTCLGSRNEHCIRVESPRPANLTQYFAVVGGDLTMARAAPPNKQGGCVELRWQRYASVVGTVCRVGQVRTGPYGETQTLKAATNSDRVSDYTLVQDVDCRDGAAVYVRAGSGWTTVVRGAGGVKVERDDPEFPRLPTHDTALVGVDPGRVKKVRGDSLNLTVRP